VTTDEVMGPIGYLVVEFPDSGMTGEGLPILVDLVDRGIIRVLDLVFATKDQDGTLTVIDVDDFDSHGDATLSIFVGASSGLIGDDDLSQASEVVAPGATVAVMVYENRWAAGFVQALRGGGAQVVAAGFVTMEDLAASLDLADA
jgi:hypothetical protein